MRLCCTAQIVAVMVGPVLLAGCGTIEVFGRYDLPESEFVTDAPYPRLVDTPAAPGQGEFSAAVPDPAEGAEVQNDLSAEAIVAETRARDLAQPVIDPAEKEALLRRARRTR